MEILVMRTIMSAAVIGLTALGSAVVVGGAQAQPYGYYQSAPSGYYDHGYYRSAPTYNNGYYAPPPSYGYYDNNSGAGLAGALIGSLIGPSYGNGYQNSVPVDRFGPDPNGMIAPDGHRIKCKLRTGYDSYGRYTRMRECY